jgi:hypothetical protein
MNKLDLFVYFIYGIKILFILSAVASILLKHTNKENTLLYKNVVYLKGHFEFVFIICMAILLIYVFNPRNKNGHIHREDIRFLFYLFGFVLLIDADWKTYIGNSYISNLV